MAISQPTEQLTITNIEGLKEQNIHQKITPQIIDELKQVLQEKYGIDINKNIFEITRAELEELKREIDASQNPTQTLEKFLYQEYQETSSEKKQSDEIAKQSAFLEQKLKIEGLGAVSLETVTQGIESSQLESMKKQFDEAIDKLLNTYDFLDQERKNVVKLAIANKMLTGPLIGAGNKLLSSFGNFMQTVQTMDAKKLEEIASKGESSETIVSPEGSEFERIFSQTLQPYTKNFDEIGKKLEQSPALSKEQKQNIISHIDYFIDPRKIEQGFDEKILTLLTPEFIASHKDKPVTHPKIDIDGLKQYMLSAHLKIESIAQKMEHGGKILDGALNMASMDGMLGDGARSVVEMMLNLPIIGKILAMFMGLNGNDPLAEFNEQTQQFKFLKELKSLGVQKNAKGEVASEGTAPFEGINLSQISFREVKNEIKTLLSYKNPEMTEKDFWIQVFSEQGIPTKDGVNLKLKITDEHKKDKSINSAELKEIIKEGNAQYAKELEQKGIKDAQDARTRQEAALQQKQKDAAEKAAKAQSEVAKISATMTEIDAKVNDIDNIITKKYASIKDWDDNLNIGNISDIPTQEIVNYSFSGKDDFSSVIGKTIGIDDYNKIAAEDKRFLNVFLSYIGEYCGSKGITYQGSLKDFIIIYETPMIKWLKEKKDALKSEKMEKAKVKETKEAETTATQQQLETLSLQQKQTARAKEIHDKIGAITQETSLVSQGIDVGNNEKITFDKEKQQLKIGEKEYSISGIDATITDIIIKGDEVIFTGEKMLMSGKESVSKQKFQLGIQEIYEKGRYQLVNGKNTITIAQTNTPSLSSTNT